MVQGDQYALPITVKTKAGLTITDEDVSKVRIKLGEVDDNYPDGDVTYDSDTGKWLLPLTQEQTLQMEHVRLQVRVVYPNGDIINSAPQVINVREADIKEVETNGGDNGND